ncbi:MAG: tetratricopeptide repeat protein [Myxococcota bacterium]
MTAVERATRSRSGVWITAGAAALAVAVGVRMWNALAGPLMWGYDAWGHVAYVLFLDLYGALPYADQGWSYYQPPLHYALGWVLASAGSGDVLMRGLSLLGGAASLGIALLAAGLARGVHPGRPALALTAFCAVAFLPVHLTVGNMPGNEMTLAFFNAASIASFIANERRARPTLAGDVTTAVLLALALLTKHNALVALTAVLASLFLRASVSADPRASVARAATRAAVVLAVVAAIAGPLYLRNWSSTGKLIPTNRDYALVASIEAPQPPQVRRPLDYLRFAPSVLLEPNPLSPALLHSVWGSLYTNVWADTHRESDRERALVAERRLPPAFVGMVWLGLLPTTLAALGAALALRDVRGGRRRADYLPLLLLTAVMLCAFAVFAWMVPRWSALKASYCLSLSLPFALFLARGVEATVARLPRPGTATVAVALTGVALAAAAVGTDGIVLPRRLDSPATGAVRFSFGEYGDARSLYGRLIEGSGYKAPWLENLAAVELAQGRPDRARLLYDRAIRLARERGLGDPRQLARRGVAEALDGDIAAARASFDAALVTDALPEVLANRGVLRGLEGDRPGAIADLEHALRLDPQLLPAALQLAAELREAGRAQDARAAADRAAAIACETPRGYPYGLGTGEILAWGVGRRWLLTLDDQSLQVTLPDFHRQACSRFGGAPAPTRTRSSRRSTLEISAHQGNSASPPAIAGQANF